MHIALRQADWRSPIDLVVYTTKNSRAFLGGRTRLQGAAQVNPVSKRCELLEMISLDVLLMALCCAETE
ncbi:hypothetical protein [Paraburkholderia phenazinium]|jgi:hypothetical protein|uniref:hypothetical protein n=1 Tax=Paraburkholderia phenazinium TaxID=60549 RepID=UPI00115FD0C0|nr:hypothetical protein [Paraburkholderia phenazinium]